MIWLPKVSIDSAQWVNGCGYRGLNCKFVGMATLLVNINDEQEERDLLTFFDTRKYNYRSLEEYEINQMSLAGRIVFFWPWMDCGRSGRKRIKIACIIKALLF